MGQYLQIEGIKQTLENQYSQAKGIAHPKALQFKCPFQGSWHIV